MVLQTTVARLLRPFRPPSPDYGPLDHHRRLRAGKNRHVWLIGPANYRTDISSEERHGSINVQPQLCIRTPNRIIILSKDGPRAIVFDILVGVEEVHGRSWFEFVFESGRELTWMISLLFSFHLGFFWGVVTLFLVMKISCEMGIVSHVGGVFF
ncbi:hypothetical protein IEQ34_016160 [Dendrobium chrysotoxum]|uniref:Uncharacterized protein n=1 Tax=Dendrobium chrysotoxum TaxID=161865 RepID=A0AAV7GDB9_DENCH|nr:hypothetical protein IEQ34_016160 [Dendrobium chrysotoxum]